MKPLFRHGYILACEKAAFDTLRKRDIIVFSAPRSGEKIVHRIIRIDFRKRHIKTKGDGSLLPDPFTIREEDIIGRITSYSRSGSTTVLTPMLLYVSYLYSKFMHPYRKIKSIIKTQTIFRHS